MDVLWERTGALSRAQRGLRVGAGDVASGRETPVGPRAMEYLLFVLYFSFFLCLCTLVCLYFSGCQELTYRHEGKRPAQGASRPWAWRLALQTVLGDAPARRLRVSYFGVPSFPLSPV